MAASSPSPVTAEWGKTLTRSDAQRKATGNQRGSITLVRGSHSIDPQTYFRSVLFRDVYWQDELTRTGETRESALITMDCVVGGSDLGPLAIPATHAANREAGQNNYTTLLHLGPLRGHFERHDLTGHYLRIRRYGNGMFALSIS